MFKLFKIVEERDSKFNGKIQIVKDLQGSRIIAGGISQSGWLVKSIWKAALKKITNHQIPTTDVLILGLGGGSAAEIVSKYWKDAKIVGVDIDPIMVEMGKKYLQLGNLPNLEIEIADATLWIESKVTHFAVRRESQKSSIRQTQDKKKKFDLILIDLFNGNKIPAQFYGEKFIKTVSQLLAPGGIVAFNHLYSFSEKEDAQKLHKNLRKIFPQVTSVIPEANIIFLCFSK